MIVPQEFVQAALQLAERQVHAIGGEFRCGECCGGWVERWAPKHAESCRVGQVLRLAGIFVASRAGEADSSAALRNDKQAALRSDRQKSGYEEPWRVATSDEVDPRRGWAGDVLNGRDAVVVSGAHTELDYREEPLYLQRIVLCVNFCEGLLDSELLAGKAASRELMAEVLL